MLVLPQTVRVKWNGRNKKWYTEKGYTFTKLQNEFDVDVLDLPLKSNTYVEVLCDFCNIKVLQPYSHYNLRHKENSDACSNCGHKKAAKSNFKYTFDDVKREFEKRDYTLLETEYKGTNKHYKYICSQGHETKITFQKLLQGRGCKQCSIQNRTAKQRMSIEEVKKIFKENNCTLLTTKYINNTQKLRFICECGNEDIVSLAHFLRGQRCKKCAFNRKRNAHLKYDIDFLKKLFLENGCILLEDEYIEIHNHMRYICVCGRESKIALSSFLYGVRCRNCANDKKRGENNPRWNFNKSEEERIIERSYVEYREWRNEVYQRDDYTCQSCGDDKGGNLVAHHIDSYDWCKERRLDVNNGITLCSDCHKDFHHNYGYGNNTESQFEKWIKN